ncbi:hypothetical protein P171DRAFT_5413 [Karstenula rhodostoma CBS 690.94]|uniref:Uncharacterized protein n=1 Tax=Karstenula rhodostoma CBS 690.94 TaxID=1392251 RepID=A0A9P4PVU9_9PLEO|nr:hypothetical protein P171DRAFT_5413 [Karstenula rhodostoma CBS 690.94]
MLAPLIRRVAEHHHRTQSRQSWLSNTNAPPDSSTRGWLRAFFSERNGDPAVVFGPPSRSYLNEECIQWREGIRVCDLTVHYRAREFLSSAHIRDGNQGMSECSRSTVLQVPSRRSNIGEQYVTIPVESIPHMCHAAVMSDLHLRPCPVHRILSLPMMLDSTPGLLGRRLHIFGFQRSGSSGGTRGSHHILSTSASRKTGRTHVKLICRLCAVMELST